MCPESQKTSHRLKNKPYSCDLLVYVMVMINNYIVCLKTYVTKFSWVFPTPTFRKTVPINMGIEVNRLQDIHCCVEIREML
jgi:hypothetical protein